jgi:hypothetical protein
MKRLLKKWLLELLKDDYEVKIAVTKVANPDLAYEIETQAKKMPPPPKWWDHVNWNG